MENTSNGALSFKAILENDDLLRAIDETVQRVQGLSDETASSGRLMDKAFQATSENIRQALGKIGTACEIHEAEIAKLEAQYDQLGKDAGAAFSAGNQEAVHAIQERQASIQGEIAVRKQVLAESRNLSDALEQEAQKREEATRAVETNAKAHQSLRSRIRELKEDMAFLVDKGINEESEAYKKLVNELGRLQDIQGDISQQGRILANDEAKFQGVIQGISGLSGGLSAATGAVSLFAGENDNLQKVMTKVQSVMAITMGMQQVAQTLNKDSAFRLVTLNNLKKWWTGIVKAATVAETEEAVAVETNTIAQQHNAVASGANATAQGVQTASAVAGTTANFTLAGAFRAVGVAISSIPGVGWLLAALTAIAGTVAYFVNKANEAEKESREWAESVADGAYKQLASFEKLKRGWDDLGNSLEEKRKYIRDNAKEMQELRISTDDVTQAERVFTAGAKPFRDSLIARAKAAIAYEKAMKSVKEAATYDEMAKNASNKKPFWSYIGTGGSSMNVTSQSLSSDAKSDKEIYLEKAEKARKEIDEAFKDMATWNKEASTLEKNAGINSSSNSALEGTRKFYQEKVREANEALDNLKIGSKEYIAKQKEIAELEKKLQEGKGSKSKHTQSAKDPFLEELKKRKEAYEDYKRILTGGDDIAKKNAQESYKKLIENGKTYLEYLQKERDKLLSDNPKANAKKINTLDKAISEESGKDALKDYSEALSQEIAQAKTAVDALSIIAEKRKALLGDGSYIDNAQREILDRAEKDSNNAFQSQVEKLLTDYAGYLDRKLELDRKYQADLSALALARVKATTDEERARIDRAMTERKKQYSRDSKVSGDSEYDKMIQTYSSFEEKRAAIAEEYDEKIAIAREHKNKELEDRLNKEKGKAMSKLAIDEMRDSPDWAKLFGNFSEMGTKELEKLLSMIEGKTAVLGIELSPEDFKVIQDKVKALGTEIRTRNPFKGIAKGFKDLKNATNDDAKIAAMAGIFEDSARAGNQLKGVLEDVTQTLDALGVEGTEEIGHAVKAIEGFSSGAQDAVMGFMSGNPVQAVSGTIKAVGSAISYFAGANDRRAERSIKRHQENINNLTSSYKELEWQISKALSGESYKHSQAAIKNMKQQQIELQGMMEAERGKKKKDDGKIREWQERKRELDRNIADMVSGMQQKLLGTDAKGVASQLGDALVSAFENGKNAAEAWGNTVKNIVNGLVKNILIQKVLEEPIKNIINKYTDRWVDKDGRFNGFNVVTNSVDALYQELNAELPKVESAFNAIKSKLKFNDDKADTSLTGAVKGVSEETASIVAGQLNAMRINQGEANNMLRQQLASLSQIAQNTAYNKLLVDIHRELKDISAGSGNLRSQGLK